MQSCASTFWVAGLAHISSRLSRLNVCSATVPSPLQSVLKAGACHPESSSSCFFLLSPALCCLKHLEEVLAEIHPVASPPQPLLRALLVWFSGIADPPCSRGFSDRFHVLPPWVSLLLEHHSTLEIKTISDLEPAHPTHSVLASGCRGRREEVSRWSSSFFASLTLARSLYRLLWEQSRVVAPVPQASCLLTCTVCLQLLQSVRWNFQVCSSKDQENDHKVSSRGPGQCLPEGILCSLSLTTVRVLRRFPLGSTRENQQLCFLLLTNLLLFFTPGS